MGHQLPSGRGLGIDLALFYMLLDVVFRDEPLSSLEVLGCRAAAFVVATAMGYQLQRRFTFRAPPSKGLGRAGRFWVATLRAGATNIMLFATFMAMARRLGWTPQALCPASLVPYVNAVLAGTAVVLGNFWAQRTWTFRRA